MDDTTKIIRDFYNQNALGEWNRIAGRPEFLITCKFIDKYVESGDKVLDIGGGPGRYSVYLAEKGCDVTLFDLSEENVKLASERGIKAITGDARTVDEHFTEQFDHILLMGPMYHLLAEADRIKAINAALKLLKPNGKIYISFISLYAGMVYALKFAPELLVDKSEDEYLTAVLTDTNFAGLGFTYAFNINPNDVLPFMSQFPLEKLHYFGQEAMMSPGESNIMSQSKEVIDAWIDFSVKVCEREELLSWAEHLMYIGKKL